MILNNYEYLNALQYIGCGGYLIGDGIISSPNYLSNAEIGNCFWFLEARNSEDTILLRRNTSINPITAATLSHQIQPLLIARNHLFINSIITININNYFFFINHQIYDGWSRDGLVLYDGNSTNKAQEEAVIYSVSNKMMVLLKPPKVKENQHVFHWNTFTVLNKI